MTTGIIQYFQTIESILKRYHIIDPAVRFFNFQTIESILKHELKQYLKDVKEAFPDY